MSDEDTAKKPLLQFTVEAYGVIENNQMLRVIFKCGERTTSSYLPLPPENYKDGGRFRDWLRLHRETMQQMLPQALLDQAAITAAQAAHTVTSQMGMSTPDRKDVEHMINSHAKFLSQGAKKRMRLRSPGQPSPWTPHELESAVLLALRPLSAKERTYEAVVSALQDNDKDDRAPVSKGALRKLLTRMGLDWKRLKGTQI